MQCAPGPVETAGPRPQLTSSDRLRNILGGSAGNFVEWFDWFAYVSFAIYFSRAIFPGDDQTTQLLKTSLPFALGFIARPIGAYVMGAYADRAGRKVALTLSVSIMCAGSLAIALVPTHAQIGIWAPIILTAARIAQGWSVGGEYGASATYVSEMAGKRRRGFWSGFLYVTIIGGQLAAMLMLVVLQSLLTDEQMYAWGWRIPFVVGAALGVVVFWIRSRMQETTQFEEKATKEDRGRALMLFTHYPWTSLAIFIFTAGGGAAFYFYTGYLKDFLVNSAHGPDGTGFSKEAAAMIASIILVVFMILQPLLGFVSDYVGRKRMLLMSFAIGAIAAYPAMTGILNATSYLEVLMWIAVPMLALAGYTSISAIIKAELFPAHIRASGVAVPHAAAQALFGGNVAALALTLKKAGHETWIFWIIAALLAFGFAAGVALRDPQKHSLLDND